MNPLVRTIADLSVRAASWQFETELPSIPKWVGLAVPHTSNWDGLLLLGTLTHIAAALVLPFLFYLSWARGRALKPLAVRLLPLALLLAVTIYGLKAYYPAAPQIIKLADTPDPLGIGVNFLLFWSRLLTTAH